MAGIDLEGREAESVGPVRIRPHAGGPFHLTERRYSPSGVSIQSTVMVI